MNSEQFHDAMNHLDQNLVEEVDTLRRAQRVKRPVIRVLIPAACLCIALLGAVTVLPRLSASDSTENGAGGSEKPVGVQEQLADGAAGSDVDMYGQSIDYSKQNGVSYAYGYANLTVYLPDGWEYEIREYDAEGYSFGIDFWPAGYSGKVSVSFYTSWGVCGTGLEQEEITLNGHKAWMGTYDNHAVWDFISFEDLPGNYVVINEGMEEWEMTHRETVMEILENMELAKDIMTSQEAIDIAKSCTEAEYDDVRATFVFEEGNWHVVFRKNNVNVDMVVVTMEE